jgi:hypothetical protein
LADGDCDEAKMGLIRPLFHRRSRTSISDKNREFFETSGNVRSIKRDLATGSGRALGFEPRRRAEAMVWIREKNARALRADRWKAAGALIVALTAAAFIIKGMIKW